MAKYILQPLISHQTALEIVNAAITEATKLEVSISVAVVDSQMSLVAFAKTDGATPHSAETSRRKANTAASTKKPTGWMSEELAVTLPLGSGNLLTNIPGGEPIVIEDKVVGGFGIAGGTVEQDAAVAAAVLKSLKA